MNWISTKEKLPGTEIYKNRVFLVYKIGNDYPDFAWFITHEKGYSFTIGTATDQTYEPDFWCEIQKPNQPDVNKLTGDKGQEC